MSQDRLLVDWFRRATLVVNVDGVLLGFIVLIASSAISENTDNFTVINAVYVGTLGQQALIYVSMVLLATGFVLALVAIFSLTGRNRINEKQNRNKKIYFGFTDKLTHYQLLQPYTTFLLWVRRQCDITIL